MTLLDLINAASAADQQVSTDQSAISALTANYASASQAAQTQLGTDQTAAKSAEAARDAAIQQLSGANSVAVQALPGGGYSVYEFVGGQTVVKTGVDVSSPAPAVPSS